MAWNRKSLTPDKLFIGILIGVCLLVIVWPSEKKTGGSLTAGSTNSAGTAGTYTADTEYRAYAAELESRLKTMLQEMRGIDKVDVMITIKNADGTSVQAFSSRSPEIDGVLVLVKGREGVYTKYEIMEAVKVLFSLESHKVKVLEME